MKHTDDEEEEGRTTISSCSTFCDAPPPNDAPRAGGCVVRPKPPSRCDGDWECWLEIERTITTKRSSNSSNGPCGDETTNQAAVKRNDNNEEEVTLTGGCHCGSVRFECQIPSSKPLIVWDCNCSDCRLRRNSHFILSKSKLVVTSGQTNLAIYRWGSGQSIHQFCATCGITPFYIPRSNADGIAITFACVDNASMDTNLRNGIQIKRFDGNNWEEHIANEGKSIRDCSK